MHPKARQHHDRCTAHCQKRGCDNNEQQVLTHVGREGGIAPLIERWYKRSQDDDKRPGASYGLAGAGDHIFARTARKTPESPGVKQPCDSERHYNRKLTAHVPIPIRGVM
jgi:hypothetical protein